MQNMDREPTAEQLRDNIDRGRTGDKVSWPDPAAAPLGTDDEAGAAAPPVAAPREPISRAETRRGLKAAAPGRSHTGKIEGPIPNRGISRFNDEYGLPVLICGLGLLVVIAFFLAR